MQHDNLKHETQIAHDLSSGRHRLLDPNGTMYPCDYQGYKRTTFLPDITGNQGYKNRLELAIVKKVMLHSL